MVRQIIQCVCTYAYLTVEIYIYIKMNGLCQLVGGFQIRLVFNENNISRLAADNLFWLKIEGF